MLRKADIRLGRPQKRNRRVIGNSHEATLGPQGPGLRRATTRVELAWEHLVNAACLKSRLGGFPTSHIEFQHQFPNREACCAWPVAARGPPPWVHSAFSEAKIWSLGVYDGLRRQHLQNQFEELVFRFNRRQTRHARLPPPPRSRPGIPGTGRSV